MKISKRDRTLLIVCVVGLFILVWGLLNPPSKTAGPAKLLSFKEAEHKREIAEHTVIRLKGEQAENEPRIKAMSYDLPAEQLEPRIIRNLQQIATRAGVHIQEVKPLRPRSLPTGLERVPMEVRFRSAFQPNVIRFLYFTEEPAAKMVVDKMNVTSADPRFRTVDVTVQITVFTRAATAVAGTSQGENKSVNAKTDNI